MNLFTHRDLMAWLNKPFATPPAPRGYALDHCVSAYACRAVVIAGAGLGLGRAYVLESRRYGGKVRSKGGHV